jgi:hypothetical protein
MDDIFDNILLKERKEKLQDKKRKRIDNKYQEIVDVFKDKIAQIIIIDAESYIHNDSYCYDNVSDFEHIFDEKEEILPFLKEIHGYLKDEDIIRNLKLCPDMQFLYENGFLKIDDYEISLDQQKFVIFKLLEKHLIFDLIKIVLHFC